MKGLNKSNRWMKGKWGSKSSSGLPSLLAGLRLSLSGNLPVTHCHLVSFHIPWYYIFLNPVKRLRGTISLLRKKEPWKVGCFVNPLRGWAQNYSDHYQILQTRVFVHNDAERNAFTKVLNETFWYIAKRSSELLRRNAECCEFFQWSQYLLLQYCDSVRKFSALQGSLLQQEWNVISEAIH